MRNVVLGAVPLRNAINLAHLETLLVTDLHLHEDQTYNTRERPSVKFVRLLLYITRQYI